MRALRSGLETSEAAWSGLEIARRSSGNQPLPARIKSSQLESAIYSFIHGLVLYIYIYIYIYILPCWFVAALITERFRAKCLRRASKLLRPSPRLFPRGMSHLEAPEALGAASWRLQRLWEHQCDAPGALGAAISRLQKPWEQLSRGSRGSGSGHLDAPEARRAPISTLQRLQEHPSRGSRGSGSGHREAPEALGAAISRLQELGAATSMRQRLWGQPSRGSSGYRRTR